MPVVDDGSQRHLSTAEIGSRQRCPQSGDSFKLFFNLQIIPSSPPGGTLAHQVPPVGLWPIKSPRWDFGPSSPPGGTWCRSGVANEETMDQPVLMLRIIKWIRVSLATFSLQPSIHQRPPECTACPSTRSLFASNLLFVSESFSRTLALVIFTFL
jgi:hypothetical protein